MKQFLYLIQVFLTLHSQGQTSSFDSDWQILQNQISNSQIVGVGEAGHGYESLNKNKSAFINFLRDEFKFKAVAFESPFVESIISYLNNDSPGNRTKNFLYPFWNTISVKSALKKFIEEERTFAQPLVVGFDIQEDCRFEMLSVFLGKNEFVTKTIKELNDCDSILSLYIGKDFSRKGAITDQEYRILTMNYDLVKAELKMKSLGAFQEKLLQRCLDNRKWLCKYLTFPDRLEKMFFRDSLMAANIIWLQKEIYSENKFIIWAANTHIAKLNKDSRAQWTGEWLSSIYGDKYAAIAFQKGAAKNIYTWQNASFHYTLDNKKKFNAVFYVNDLKKIGSHEWITPCE